MAVIKKVFKEVRIYKEGLFQGLIIVETDDPRVKIMCTNQEWVLVITTKDQRTL